MAPKRKLDEEDGDISAGSVGEEKQDGAASATEADSPAKKGRGRPRKSDLEKKPYTPTGNPRGRPRTKIPGSGADTRKKRGRPSLSSKSGTDSSDVEGSPSASPKKRGRPSLASKRGTDNDVNNESTNQPRKRGRPLGSSKKQKGDKAARTTPYIPTGKPRVCPLFGEIGPVLLSTRGANISPRAEGLRADIGRGLMMGLIWKKQPPSKNKTYIPTGKPRGRRPLGENGAKKPPYIPTGKPRGRRPLGENGAKKPPYIPTGKPTGRRPLGENGAKKTTPYIPTGKPRGRRPLGENGAKKTTPYIPTGKPRGRRPLGENGAKKTTPYIPTGKPRGRRPLLDCVRQKYVPTGKPRGRKPIGDKAIQVKKKYFKKEKYRLQVKPFKIRRAKFKPKPTEKKFMTVKPLKTEPPPKIRSVPITVQLAQSHKDEKTGSPHVNLRNSRTPHVNLCNSGTPCVNLRNSGTPHRNLRNSGTPSVNPTIFNVTTSRGSNVRYPMLNEYQRSLLHVNHSKHLLNYDCDREPALDVLQKKLLAVNTQLIDTKEQRLELDKRIIIFKQRKIELERQLLNYRPQRRVLTRVEQIPVIDMVNGQQSGVQHGAKIQGWVSVADNHVKVPNCSPSVKNCEHNPKVQTSGPLHSRARSSVDDSKEVKKPKKVTSRSEKRGRGRPRKQE